MVPAMRGPWQRLVPCGWRRWLLRDGGVGPRSSSSWGRVWRGCPLWFRSDYTHADCREVCQVWGPQRHGWSCHSSEVPRLQQEGCSAMHRFWWLGGRLWTFHLVRPWVGTGLKPWFLGSPIPSGCGMLSQWGRECYALDTSCSVHQPLLREGPVAGALGWSGRPGQRSQQQKPKGRRGKLYCTLDSEATMLDRERFLPNVLINDSGQVALSATSFRVS